MKTPEQLRQIEENEKLAEEKKRKELSDKIPIELEKIVDTAIVDKKITSKGGYIEFPVEEYSLSNLGFFYLEYFDIIENYFRQKGWKCTNRGVSYVQSKKVQWFKIEPL